MAATRIPPPPPMDNKDPGMWTSWYNTIHDAISRLNTTVTTYVHNSLGSIQGGTTDQYYHLTAAQYAALVTVSGVHGQTLYNDSGTWTATSSLYYDSANSSYGIGTTTPTAWLHIKAGTTAQPPLKFTTGTLTTAGEAGALEYATGRLHFTGVGDRMVIDQTEQTETASSSVSNTTTETTLHSHTIAAGEFVVGRLMDHRHLGRYTKDVSSDTFDLNIYLDSTLITTFTVPGSGATDTQLDLQMFGTCRSTGVSGTVQTYIKCQMGGINYYYFDTTPMTYDTTISHTITSKVQWGAAKAGNVVYYDQGWLTWKG